MVASDKCKISKAIPSAMGLRIRDNQMGLYCSGKGIQRQEEMIGWVEKEKVQRWMTREENDGNQKHKVYFSGKEESHLAGINLSDRKELGDEDKQMGLKPINL